MLTPDDVGLEPARRSRPWRPERRSGTPRSPARVLAGERRRRARPDGAQRRRRDLRRRARRLDRGRRAAGRAGDRLRRGERRAGSASSSQDPGGSQRRERAVWRRSSRRPARPSSAAARSVPLAELERGTRARADDGVPFAEALARPGTSLIAEHKRRSPSAGEIRAGLELRGDRGRLRARRRRGAVGAHRGGPLRRLARRPARRARGDRFADPAQGLHGRPLPALRGAGAGADAVLLVVGSLARARARRRSMAAPRDSISTRSSRSRPRGRARGRARRSTPT